MIAGIFGIGLSVGSLRLSCFGVDAFSCMNLGVSSALGWTFGNWQLLVNVCILTLLFFADRSCIGPGTVINMTVIGYMADALYAGFGGVPHTLPVRVALLAAGLLFSGIGVAAYMLADMGLSPYDSVGVLIEKATRNRLTYGRARILSDITVVAAGTASCLLSGHPLETVVGIGTLCTAFLTGPLIQMFKTMFQSWLTRIAEG